MRSVVKLDWMSYKKDDYIILYSSKLAACADMHKYVPQIDLKHELCRALGLDDDDDLEEPFETKAEVAQGMLERLPAADQSMIADAVGKSYASAKDVVATLALVAETQVAALTAEVVLAIETKMGLRAPDPSDGTVMVDALRTLDALEALDGTVAAKVSAVYATPEDAKAAFDEIVRPKTLAEARPEVLAAVQTKLFTRHGTEQEAAIRVRAAAESRTAIKTCEAFRVSAEPMLTVEGIEVYVGGRHDGMTHTVNEHGAQVPQIVEIKTRQRRFLGTPLYELVQVHAYMHMYGIRNACIIESYEKVQRRHEIEFDDALWGAVQSGVAAFLTGVFRSDVAA